MVWLSACAAVALAGCSTNAKGGASTVTVSGSTLTVYASQPPGGSGGQEASDIVDAEQLALQHAGGKAGKYTVKLVELHGHELSDNARTAIENQTSIAYLGELQPGTSQIPVEITNQQGLLVVSPADTAAYLTQPVPPPVATSPSSYYPSRSTYNETFARVVPNSARRGEGDRRRDAGRARVTAVRVQRRQPIRRDDRRGGLTRREGGRFDRRSAARSRRRRRLLRSQRREPGGAHRGHARARQRRRREPEREAVRAVGPLRRLVRRRTEPGRRAAAGRLLARLPAQVPDAGGAGLHLGVPQLVRSHPGTAGDLRLRGDVGAAVRARQGRRECQRAIHRRDRLPAAEEPADSVIGPYSISGGDPSIAPLIFARVRGGKLVPFKFVQQQG